ncbi:hypothetical protein GCM10028807_09110 [Spirosoma daeguense]
MYYVILLFCLLALPLRAQPNVTGLGAYRIDVTTPDSLNSAKFRELEKANAKGTLTLSCSHIRTFASGGVEIGGVTFTNLYLFFYDDKLFRISCDYNADIERAFVKKHGKGVASPESRLTFCDQSTDKSMLLKGEIWENGDILTLAVHAKGFNSDCQQEEFNRLIISNQQMAELSSECELQDADPFLDEFYNVINGR